MEQKQNPKEKRIICPTCQGKSYITYEENKGRIGERRVAEALSKLGFKVIHVGGAVKYTVDGSTFFCADLLSFRNGKTFWIQVKNKEPRTHYPDTGMELWRYKNLKEHQKESGLKVLVLFTDNSKEIYGEWLDGLPTCLSPHPGTMNKQTNTEMIYWLAPKSKEPLEKLKGYKELLNREGEL